MSDKDSNNQLLALNNIESKAEVTGKQDGQPSPINHPNFIPDASTKFSDTKSKPKAFLMESKPPVGPAETNSGKTKSQVS